ncbi:MAG TPA: cation diffusion facilitator family transporter [Candidatus Elarobacter sp.]|jgi:cation diffusion facilitator family transporter
MAEDSPKTVVVAVGADLLVALAKTAVAVLGGSAAMAAEAVHSFVDGINQALLIVGHKRSARPADNAHPFGHGAEVYFWALVVAGVIFAVGGGATIVEGVYRFMHPEPPKDVLWSYVVLAIAFAADGYALLVAVRELRGTYPKRSIPSAIRASKDPSVFVVVLEDSAALLGVLLAVAGTAISQVTNDGRADAAASIAIGLLLGAVAVAMMNEMSSLLTGESDPEIVGEIERIVKDDDGIAEVRRVRTMTLGPKHVLVAVDVVFRGDPSLGEAADVIARVEDEVRKRRPIVSEVLIPLTARR